MEIENFLQYLNKVNKIASGWNALCPAHDDHIRSLAVGVGDDGKILIKCHAGCHPEDILKALKLKWSDLFPKQYSQKHGITIAELAFDKGFSKDFLIKLGIEETENHVRITYYLEDGSLAPRQRQRSALSAREGSYWERGNGKPVPYGLWKLKAARASGCLFLVEGESDCWTLWYHGYSVLGIPGADMTQKLEAEHVRGIKKIYIVKEPDQGGQTFVRGMQLRLKKIGYRGLAFVVEMCGAKDPNDLHNRNSEAFRPAFESLRTKAKPLVFAPTPKKMITTYGTLIPTLPEPENETVLKLMEKAVASQKHFAILAPQGSGKSYANCFIAVELVKQGRSSILASRSHDELNQMGRTIKTLLQKNGLDECHLFHLKGGTTKDEEDAPSSVIPEVRPIIVIAPHIYFQFKGETPYHHTLVEMIFQEEFGELPLVIIDEMTSFVEMCFVSKTLGARESLKKVFGEELCVKNRSCPLFTASGNCLNCTVSMDLVLRRGPAGMLYYVPISQRHKDDRIKQEQLVCTNFVKWDMGYDDNTMKVYPLVPPQNFASRKWSRGGKKDLQLKISLQAWFEDLISRIVEPHLVFFYPYEVGGDNIGRPLTAEELDQRKNGRLLVPPRHVCEVPIVQGWDLAILREMKKYCQIGFTGPGARESDRYVLNQALGEIEYHIAKTPFVQFSNLLIIILEKDLLYEKRETLELLKAWAAETKILSFLPTYFDATKAEESISEEIRTIYYDGAQKVRNAPIEGTSIEFDVCISCIHGPLGQGMDLGQFKIVKVATACERPKCLFAGHPPVKSNKEYIIDDVGEKCRQAALRSLRLTLGENADAPRVFVIYGERYTWDIAKSLQTELQKVGHTAKLVNAKQSLKYTQEIALKWLHCENIAELEAVNPQEYQKAEMLESLKRSILEYLEEHPKSEWRDVVRNLWRVRNLADDDKENLRQWFQQDALPPKEESKTSAMVHKIAEFIEERPDTSWTEVYRKYNLSRMPKEEIEVIRQYVGL